MRHKIYEYKRKAYIVISEQIRMKHSNTGIWVDAILYSRICSEDTIPEPVSFVRNRQDFLAKFKPVEN